MPAKKAWGGALLQSHNAEGKLQPVTLTSNSLSSTEQCYSQIEKECLAICSTFGKFDHWLFSKSDITVHTDHEPLETIFKKPLHKSPACLEWMLKTLQRYQFSLRYKKGTSLHVADTLSRAALPTPVQAKVTGFEVFRLELEHPDNDHSPWHMSQKNSSNHKPKRIKPWLIYNKPSPLVGQTTSNSLPPTSAHSGPSERN